VAHTWANERPTRGTFRLVGKGATWPSQGLPRGTPLLVDQLCVKSFFMARLGVKPVTSGK
jgi:hypothetical protein